MSEYIPYDESKFDRKITLGDLINTPDDSDIVNFLGVDLSHPGKTKEKSKIFPFAPEIGKINLDNFTPYMNKNKSKCYTQTKKLIREWTDKKFYLILYRLLKFYVRHGMRVEKDPQKFSF